MKKQIPEAPNYYIYSNGKIWSSNRNKFLISVIMSNGYHGISLYNNGIQLQRLVHRLVAKAFISNPENKPQVNHKDNNKLNNHISNLEWVTCSENHLHAYANGKSTMKGEKHPLSILTEGKVVAIKLAIKNGVKNRYLADKYNVSQQIICDINKGRRWNHVIV